MVSKFSFHSINDLTQPDCKRRLNQQLFTIVAPRYNLITRLLSFGRDKHWKRKLVTALPLKNNIVCVDLACGNGDLTKLLAQSCNNGCVIGLDLTPAMLQLAQSDTITKDIFYLRADMMQLPLRDNSIDVITGGYALRNAPSLNRTLTMIYEKLKPGGVASFLEFSRSNHRFLSWVQLSLLTIWANFCGSIVHGNRHVYGYIPASLKLFPTLETLAELTQSHGFIHFHVKKYMLGIITLITFEKPLEEVEDAH